MNAIRSIHIFCRVVDNFGDIGVSWRLARQLAGECGRDIVLWVDDLASFQKLCRRIDPTLDTQAAEGVLVKRWSKNAGAFPPEQIPDLVIEAFGCELPAVYVAAMAERSRPPVWINLEHLSAESWVEGCHALPSPHPRLPLTKYFFFPGFTAGTGGLPLERDLFSRRDAFLRDAHAANAFLAQLDVKPIADACRISLFCYPSAPVAALFNALQGDSAPVQCLVPQGVAAEAVGAFLGKPAEAGAEVRRGSLSVQVIPFLEQPDYDKLLWSCDLNFVRGEDSMVRAQWAARPFLWQIYPQQQQAHHEKLDAFLDRYTEPLPAPLASVLKAAWHAWNGMSGAALPWTSLRPALPALAEQAADWAHSLGRNGGLAANLIEFAEKFG